MGKRRLHHWLTAGALVGLLSVVWYANVAWQASAIFLRTSLQPCDWNEDLFPAITDATGNGGTVTRWSKLYHDNMSAIIDAHIGQFQSQVECIGQPRTRASGALTRVASEIEPWESGAEYYEEDMAQVTSAYLETYECALRRYRTRMFEDLLRQATILPATNPVFSMPSRNDEEIPLFPPLIMQWFKEVPLLEQELKVARLALERSFAYLNGHDRLRALDLSLTCLERASLDIRNAMSLVAETSACFPARVWDSRGGLYKAQ